MRKIASNYIITPEGELVKQAYFILNEGKICGWDILPDQGREIHGVEFYSGMLIPGNFNLSGVERGESILSFIDRKRALGGNDQYAVSLVSCLDWSSMCVTEQTTVSRIV